MRTYLRVAMRICVVGIPVVIVAWLGGLEGTWAARIVTAWAGVVIVIEALRALAAAAPVERSVLESWVSHRSAPPLPPRRLHEIERLVGLSSLNAFDLNYRLRLVLRGIAVERLSRRGLAIEDDDARGLMGRDTWEFLAPPKGEVLAAEGPGWHPDKIKQVVVALEMI